MAEVTNPTARERAEAAVKEGLPPVVTGSFPLAVELMTKAAERAIIAAEQAAREDERRIQQENWDHLYQAGANLDAAFRRGAEWMREQAAELFEKGGKHGWAETTPCLSGSEVVREIRALSPPQPAGGAE